jgi:hypothetical protein
MNYLAATHVNTDRTSNHRCQAIFQLVQMVSHYVSLAPYAHICGYILLFHVVNGRGGHSCFSRIIMEAMLPQTRVMCIHYSEVNVIDCINSFQFLVHLPASSPAKKVNYKIRKSKGKNITKDKPRQFVSLRP